MRRTGERNGIDRTIGHPIDQLGDLLVIGRGGVNVGQDGVGLGPSLPQEIGKPDVGVARIQLHADVAAPQIKG